MNLEKLALALLAKPEGKLLLVQARIGSAMAALRQELSQLGLEPNVSGEGLSRWQQERSPTKADQEQAVRQLAYYDFLSDASSRAPT